MAPDKDDIDRQLDEWLATEPNSSERDRLTSEFRRQLTAVLEEELATFRTRLATEIKEANRLFLKSFRDQTEHLLVQSAKAAAIRTKQFVERSMTTIQEADGSEA